MNVYNSNSLIYPLKWRRLFFCSYCLKSLCPLKVGKKLCFFLKGTVHFASVNECHLYASQVVEFWNEFFSKRCLFNLLEELTKLIPILFMTATATQQTILNWEGLTGLPFYPLHLLWLSKFCGVQHHNVDLELIVSESLTEKM